MTLQYVDSKHKLPTDSDFECSICYDNINVDEVLYGVPNCVICINGSDTKLLEAQRALYKSA